MTTQYSDPGKKILVIDDEESIREYLTFSLNRAGFEVTAVSNGLEGLRLLHEDSFVLVITDIVMPQKEGIETIMEIRKNFPTVKLIAVSGVNQKDLYLNAAGNLGADITLGKPFEGETVVNAVIKLVGTP